MIVEIFWLYWCRMLCQIIGGRDQHAMTGRELGAFIEQYPDAAWASWGDYDARQLERDAGVAACPSLLAGLQHFNVSKWNKGLYDDQPKSLKQTVESLGLVWLDTYHRGIDDARNVASIVKEMLS